MVTITSSITRVKYLASRTREPVIGLNGIAVIIIIIIIIIIVVVVIICYG